MGTTSQYEFFRPVFDKLLAYADGDAPVLGYIMQEAAIPQIAAIASGIPIDDVFGISREEMAWEYDKHYIKCIGIRKSA